MSNSRTLRRLTRLAMARLVSWTGVALLGFAGTALGDNKTWDGGGTDNNWSTADNWNAAIGASDALFFAGTTRLTPNNDTTANTTYNGLTFNNGAGAFTLGGNALTLGGNVVNNDADTQTINLSIQLNGSRSFNTTSGAIVMGNTTTITDDGAGTVTSVLTLNNTTKNNEFRGLITDGATRKVGVTLINNAYWYPQLLNGSNTFSGGTLLTSSSSRLVFGEGSAARSYTPFVDGSGNLISSQIGVGVLTLGTNATDKGQLVINSSQSGLSFYNDIVFNTTLGADLPGGVRFGKTGMTLRGTQRANLADASYIGNGGNSFTISGQITGSQGLRMMVNGNTLTLILANTGPSTNNYAGDTLLLRAYSASDLSTLQLGADNQIPDGAGKGNVNAVGKLRLNGFSETINGLNNTPSGSPSNPAYSVVENNHATTASTLTLGAGDASGSYSGVIRNGSTAVLNLAKTGSGTQTLTGASTYTGSTAVDGGTLELGASGKLDSASLGVASGAILKLVSGATLSRAAVLSVDGKVNLGGNVIVKTLVLGGVAQPAGTYGSTASAAANKNDAYFEGAGVLTAADTCTWTGGGADNYWSTAANWDGTLAAGRALFFGGTTRLTPSNDTTPGTAYAGIAFNSGAGAFTLSGSGINLTDNVVNYDGDTQTLSLDLTLSGGRTFDAFAGGLALGGSAVLDLNGTNALFRSGAQGVATAAGTTITNGAATSGTAWLTVDNNANRSALLNGRITDGATGKVGLRVMNDSFWEGLLGNADSTFSGGLTILDNTGIGTRFWVAAYNPTLAGGQLVKSELGVGPINIGTSAVDKASFFISVANRTFAHDFVIDGVGTEGRGQIQIGSGATTTLSGTLTLASTLVCSAWASGNADLLLNGRLTGSGGLTLLASGWDVYATLANPEGNNDYAGTTSILRSGSRISLGAADQLPDGAGKGGVNVVGTLRLNGFSETINGLTGSGTVHNNHAATAATLTLGAGDATASFSGTLTDGSTAALGVTKSGAGTQTLNATNTYTGATAVNGGALALGASGALASTNVTVSAGATLALQAGAALATNTLLRLDGKVELGGNATVRRLWLGGAPTGPGEWGSSASGARHVRDAYFTGMGRLTVLEGSVVGTLVMMR